MQFQYNFSLLFKKRNYPLHYQASSQLGSPCHSAILTHIHHYLPIFHTEGWEHQSYISHSINYDSRSTPKQTPAPLVRDSLFYVERLTGTQSPQKTMVTYDSTASHSFVIKHRDRNCSELGKGTEMAFGEKDVLIYFKWFEGLAVGYLRGNNLWTGDLIV